MEVLPPPGGNIQAPPYLTPTPASLACPAQNTSETYTQQVSYRPNPKSTKTTKSQKKSCLLLSSEAFNSHFGLLLCVTHQIVTLQISVISAFSVFSDFSLLYLPCLFLFIDKILILVFQLFKFVHTNCEFKLFYYFKTWKTQQMETLIASIAL